MKAEFDKRWLVRLVVLSLAMFGVYMLPIQHDHVPVYLPIESVEIEGKITYLRNEDIQRAVSGSMHGGFFTVDIDEIKRSLEELPWISSVSIRRQWPSSLNIIVQEREAIAYWGVGSLLSDEGEVFMPERELPVIDIPKLQGPDGLSRTVWRFLIDSNRKLSAISQRAVSLHLDVRRSWSMQLATGATLHLGREQATERLERFIEVFRGDVMPALEELDTVDLRYPNGFAVHAKNNNDKSAS